MKISAPRGTKDILPEEASQIRAIENVFCDLCYRYGFGEIRTPIFEDTTLFSRSIGEGTEVVTKQMYTFIDKGNRSLTLRPEGTAGVVRAYNQSELPNKGGVQRLFYIGPFFRYERPQKGRFRQFHQAGVEVFGSSNPQIDVEIIVLASYFLKALGFKDISLKINSTGCKKCRPDYENALRKFLKPFASFLCDMCQERLTSNTLRILDCKSAQCKKFLQGMPIITGHLDRECREHFSEVCSMLNKLGIDYIEDSSIVRGLDYYTRTVFEITQPGIGAQDALIGGGRYDNLVEELGGKATPAVGWASGLERIVASLKGKQARDLLMEILMQRMKPPSPPVYIAGMGLDRSNVFQLLIVIRKEGISAAHDTEGRSLKAQMKEASRLGSPYVVIIGEDEIAAGTATIRNMQTGEQEAIKQGELPGYLKNKLNLE